VGVALKRARDAALRRSEPCTRPTLPAKPGETCTQPGRPQVPFVPIRDHCKDPASAAGGDSPSPIPVVFGINFRAAGCADLGTLYTSPPFSHTPTCMRPVHFEASLWIALVRNMSMRPRNNGPLRIRPTQLGIEQQGRLPLHPASLPRTLRRFAFALWPQH